MLGLNYFTAEEAEELRVNEIIEGDKECYPKAFSKILESLKARIEDLVLLNPSRIKDTTWRPSFRKMPPATRLRVQFQPPKMVSRPR